MTKQQAREILLRHRPGSVDVRDPEVREALKLAVGDPELTAWLEDHRQFQEKLRNEHRQRPIPEGLREQILSEIPGRHKALQRSRRRLVMAAIAGVLILFSLVVFTSNKGHEEDRFATFRLRMIKASLRGYAMDVETTNSSELRRYLKTRNAQSNWESPDGLGRWPLLGGAVLTWQGRSATMICYGRKQQPERWLFVVNSSALPDPPPEPSRVFEKVNRLNTVSWSKSGLTYILAGEANDEDLESLLTSGG